MHTICNVYSFTHKSTPYIHSSFLLVFFNLSSPTMSAPKSLLLLLSLSILLLLISNSFSTQTHDFDEEEDLTFLEEDDQNDANGYEDHDFENYDDLDDFATGEGEFDDSESVPEAEIDESDVVVLKSANFSDVVEKNRYVMVEFYATWCGHCQALKPEYAAAATELKVDEVVLAKVDAGEETELAQKFNVEGYPTVFLFVDGVHKPYNGARNK